MITRMRAHGRLGPRGFARWAIGAAAFIAFALSCAGTGSRAERMILTGTPPFGPSWLSHANGSRIPAGCGPEAARILLAFYDRRYGYRFVGDDLAAALGELHRLMGTTTVLWGGVPQGLTWPWAFVDGFRAYIEARYPGGAVLGEFSSDLAQVFATSVDLIQRATPHVILFDWAGATWIFPNHYAVVVGYDRSEGRQLLVLNAGWGYDFQVLDMSDPAVAPASLVWIEEIRNPPEAAPGLPLGRLSAQGMWTTDDTGQVQLRPVLRLHNDPQSTVRWPISTRTTFLVRGAGDLAIAVWEGP